LNEADIILKYYGPAHTDSDISVNFTEADVVHVGDTWIQRAAASMDLFERPKLISPP
jgi:hypothetical protein